MNTLVWGATILGLILGGLAAFSAIRGTLLVRVEKSTRPALLAYLAMAGFVVIFLPAVFLAFVVGGTAGGAIAERLFSGTNVSSGISALGLGLGVAIVFSCMLFAGTAVGVLVGQVLVRRLDRLNDKDR